MSAEGGGATVRPQATAAIDAAPAAGRRSTLPALAIVAALALFIVVVTRAGAVAAAAHLVIALTAVAATYAGVVRHAPSRRGPWWVLCVGVGLCALGRSWASIVGAPGPGWAVLVLAGDAALAAGLIAFRRARREDLPNVLVGLGNAFGVIVCGWALILVPLRAAGSPVLLGWVGLTGGALGLGVAAALVAALAGRRAAAVSLLLGTILGTVTAMSWWIPGGSEWALTLSALSLIALGVAALLPSMTWLTNRPVQPVRALSGPRIISAIAAVLLPVLALGVQSALSLPLTVGHLVIASVIMFAISAAHVVLGVDQSEAAAVERERAQREIAHQAAHDSLTGLPNRGQLVGLVSGALNRTQRTGSALALLFIDLDGFKVINDSLGHPVGDEVLRAVARRMTAAVRAGDLVSRIGGDEFVVLLEPVDSDDAARRAAERLIETVSMPITLHDGRQIGVGASVGIAMSVDGGTDAEALMQEADVAVYRAKQTGKGHAEVFDQSLRSEQRHRTAVETGVIAAIQNDELVVHYQPIVSVLTLDVLGYEALVRWRRPDGTVVAPADFILIAEQSDLICDLDSFVLQRATRQLAEWNAQRSRGNLFVSVNMSGRHIVRSRLLEDVDQALAASGVDPRQLVLEITETALIDDTLAISNLEALRAKGISISIDDFGAGYNSIARLEQLPVDIVKIDSRFLDRGGPTTNTLLRLIVQAAHAFGLPVVAEGVEQEEQLELLRSIEAESAQGYLLGRPADPATIDARSPQVPAPVGGVPQG